MRGPPGKPGALLGARGPLLPNPLVFLDVALFADQLPITAENFRCLCTGERSSSNSSSSSSNSSNSSNSSSNSSNSNSSNSSRAAPAAEAAAGFPMCACNRPALCNLYCGVRTPQGRRASGIT
ncbi:hypothetical protein Emed_000784 [Eimeria media]